MSATDPFARYDPSDDRYFYAVERKTVHIEAGAIGALRDRYAELLPPGDPILDLMSSWRSHLPEAAGLGPVTGLGMNAAEMADNPQLADSVVQNLNVNPDLPFDDDAFGGMVCTVSVQYLTRPLEVFAEVRRVLRPGAPAVIAFSNRCFPTKAVQIWLAGSDAEHRELVRVYLQQSGFSDVGDERVRTRDDPLFVVHGTA